jgi:hypothetical protein
MKHILAKYDVCHARKGSVSLQIDTHHEGVSGGVRVDLGVLLLPAVSGVLAQCHKYAHHQEDHDETCPAYALKWKKRKGYRYDDSMA